MRKKQLKKSTLYNLIFIFIWLILVAGKPVGLDIENTGYNNQRGSLSQAGLLFARLNPTQVNYTGCGGVDVPAVNEAYEQQVVDLVNEIRANQEPPLPSLILSDELTRAARYHAADMAIDGYFDHDTFDPGNPNPVCLWYERIDTYYSSWNALGENIAKGQATPQQVVNAWMNSPYHADNILNSEFNEIGVGYFKREGSSPHWVQDFGSQDAVLGNLPDEINFIYSIPMEQTYPDKYLLVPENISNSTTLSWALSSSDSWISFTPESGSTPGLFIVSPNEFSTNAERPYTGSLYITVTDPINTAGSPHTVTVRLTVIDDPIHPLFLPIINR